MVSIDVSFNNHLPNCCCKKCGQARDMTVAFRRASIEDIKKRKNQIESRRKTS